MTLGRINQKIIMSFIIALVLYGILIFCGVGINKAVFQAIGDISEKYEMIYKNKLVQQSDEGIKEVLVLKTVTCIELMTICILLVMRKRRTPRVRKI